MVAKQEKYVPTKEAPKQPKGKRAPKVPVRRVFPYRVADETGQAKGADSGGWLRAGAVDLDAGNLLGTRAFSTGMVRELSQSPIQSALHAQRIHDILANDNLPSTAVRKPYLFYRWSTPTVLAASTNNWSFEGGDPALIFQRIAASVAVNVTGIALVTNGKHLILANVGAFTITLKHQDAASSAGNRIISATGADIPVPPNGYIELTYDELTARWRAGALGTSTAPAPAPHASTHQDGGTDEINVTGLSGLLGDQQTPLTHDIITKHNGFPGGTVNFLRADGTFNAPPSATFPTAWSTPTVLSANVNDYDFAGGTTAMNGQRVTADAAGRVITGIVAKAAGFIHILANPNANNWVIRNDSILSAAANRIITGTGADLTVNQNEILMMTYDDVTARWRCWPKVYTAGAAGAADITQVEKDLGSSARRSGSFTITDAALLVGELIQITQAAGAYTGKGTLTDEAEMDQVTVCGVVAAGGGSATCYWTSPTYVSGNFKFNYLHGS